MYRVVNEVRAKELVRTPVDYIYNAEFDDASKEDAILTDMPGEEKFQADRAGKSPPKDVPAHMTHLYEWPLLNKEQEQHVFRKMNFLKHQLHKLQESIDPAKATVEDLKRAEELKSDIRL
jgi:hypothetical protein